MHVVFLNLKLIYLASKIQIFLLLTKKNTILAKYLDFENLFLKKLAIELPKYSGINMHTINLEDAK